MQFQYVMLQILSASLSHSALTETVAACSTLTCSYGRGPVHMPLQCSDTALILCVCCDSPTCVRSGRQNS